jgi:tetratricopeptide (TPR) repeat protein
MFHYERGTVKKSFCNASTVLAVFLFVAVTARGGEITKGDENLLYMKGRQLVMDGEYEKAIPMLEKAIASDPENAFINHQLAELYLRTGKLEQAEALSKKAVEKEPDNVEYRATLGGIYAANHKYEEAKQQYARVSELDPSNPKSALLIGILEAEAGDLDGGARTLTKAINDNEDNFMAYFYRAKIYLEMEKMDKAKSDLAKCQALRPSFVEAGTALGLLHERLSEIDEAIKAYSQIRGNGRFRKRLAQLYLQKNQFDKALSELLEYEQLEPDDYTTRVKIGLLFFELKRFDEAKERFNAILKEQSEADNVRFYLAAVYEETKEYDKALKNFLKVTKDSSFYKEAMLHVGFIYRAQSKTDDGISFAKKLIKANPDVVEFYDMQASFLESSRKFKEAMAVLTQGLKKFPGDEKLTYFQGAIYERLGDRPKALENMRAILVTNPKNAHALNFIGYTYTESGENLEEAENLIRQARDLRPDDGFIEDSLGWVLFKRGKTEEAMQHLERAAKLQPDEAVVYEHMGDIFQEQKAFTKAAQAYQKAYQLTVGKDKEQAKKIEAKLAKIPADQRTPSAEVK